jgi:transposase
MKSVVFYDLTTIRIHGEHELPDDLRAYGMNKETGGIARQFVLGVIQTAEGLPIAHQVHAGNVGEVTTLLPMIEATLKRYAMTKVVLVADRGLLSLDNLAAIEALRTANGQVVQYILAVPGRRYAEFADQVRQTTWLDGTGETTWEGRRLVMAHDETRAIARRDARLRTIAEIEAEGERLAERLNDQDAGKRQRGRVSTDRRTFIRFNELVKAAGLSRILKADLHAERFSFSQNKQALADAEQLDGKLLLVTNTDLTPAVVVDRYKALADIERGFRVLKSEIEIAPVHHRLPERIRAHALICFLALLIHRVMRQKLKASGSTYSPDAALKSLQTIQRHQVKVGKQTLTGINAPNPEQLQLFKNLDTKAPPMH